MIDSPRIRLRGVKQHNLKNVDLDLPLNRLIAISGVSGSGKSSLAIHTLYAEGQRRYVETFSPYTRQFLERMDPPRADLIDGIPPSIAIESGTAVRGSRSTVGTITEINDYLKLLFARLAVPHCPSCHGPVTMDTPESAARRLDELPPSSRVLIAFPIVPGSSKAWADELVADGFLRVFSKGKVFDIESLSIQSRAELADNEMLVVVDRISWGKAPSQRVVDSLATAFRMGKGRAAVVVLMAVLTYQGQSVAAPPVLSSADTMEKVFRDEPWNRPPATCLTIEAARNEVEGIQLVVVADKESVRSAVLEVSDLTAEAGNSIPKANVTWNVVGYVETEQPNYPVDKVGWWPDPLLPPSSFDVPSGQVQPLWINVQVPIDAKPGLYRGTVTLRLADGQAQSVPLEVRVWNLTVPQQQHMETCFLLRPEELQKFYKLPAVPIEMYEQWMDFCVDHRISLLLCEWPDFKTDMERLVARQLDRGGSAFCLANAWFQQGPPEARHKHNAELVAQIQELYERAKKRGWIDQAYVYCHDEIGKEQFEYARELYGELKRSMPDLRLMQTFYKDEPVSALGDVLNIWAPNTGRYRQAEFQAQQLKGDTVWWYVCCGPGKPFANLMIEWPAIDHRVLLWQNQKYGVTGFLYWSLNTWRDNLVGEQRWPEVKWNPATWRNDAGKAHNGDGQLLYPGPNRQPLSSIRLENFRDGCEDYEYFWLLRDTLTRLKQIDSAQHQALIAEVEHVLAVDDAVVKDLTHFTQEPHVLRQARAKIAGLIERAVPAASPATP